VPLNDIVPTLVPVLESFKKERQGSEGFGDYCNRLGTDALEKLLPPLPEKASRNHEAKPDGEPVLNGGPHPAKPSAGAARAATPSLPPPQTQSMAVALAAPDTKQVADAALLLPTAAKPTEIKQSETFFTGTRREERVDYTYRYASDGSVRETVVSYYEDDARAAGARPGTALRREAVYAGQADAYRLHTARKLNDTFLVGPAGQELRDRRIDYHADGRPATTTVFYYEGDRRAADAPSSAALRRQVVTDAMK